MDRLIHFSFQGGGTLKVRREQSAHILVVDDEPGAREALEALLEDQYDVQVAEDGFGALRKVREFSFDLVLLDITMPKCSGMEVLKQIKEINPSIDVVMVSALDRAHEAAKSIKWGAIDYITKPYEAENVLEVVDHLISKRKQARRFMGVETAASLKAGATEIISRSPRMQEIFEVIEKVAPTPSSVLITGESGTGKELIARAIHFKSHRAKKPFVAINCAAIPPELMESELFGHEKGAFTGAHVRSTGKFEFADGGTIFLDEISSLRMECQAKLLRVLQEREFTRVGSNHPIAVNIRVIAATNTKLDDLVKAKSFRDDLFFRLNVIPINLPPLRERKGDVSLLALYFLEKCSVRCGKPLQGITDAALNVLESYPWPGNVRELENLIERLVVLSSPGQLIEERDLPFDLLIQQEEAELDVKDFDSRDVGLLEARQAFERLYILRALHQCQWNQTDTAKLLKIHRNTLLQKMKSLHLRSSEE